jgi:hypothetical protein
MKEGDVSQAMPDNPCPDTPADEEALESLLAGHEVPAELQGVADVLAALSVPATEAELAGEAAALAAFRDVMASKSEPRASKPLRNRLTVVAILGALGIGGATAAAYAGVLPEQAQNFAHQAIGAPPAAGVRDIKPPREVQPPQAPVSDPVQVEERPRPQRPSPQGITQSEAPASISVPPQTPAPAPTVKPAAPGWQLGMQGVKGGKPNRPAPPAWGKTHKHPPHPHGGPPKGRPPGKPNPPGHK